MVASPEERSGLLGSGVQLEQCSVSHCHLRVVLLGSCRLCWAGAALSGLVNSSPPRSQGSCTQSQSPPSTLLGGVGVLLLGLNLPRAARLSSVCCHFPQAQPNLAFPVLVWYKMRRSSLLGF